jgi:LacI family transcriptional regulator, asc operon repressor
MGRGYTSVKTRQAVFKAIEELNYRPNVLAQTLAKQSTDTIGLILPTGAIFSKYLASFVTEVHKMAAKVGKSIIMKQVADKPQAALHAINELIDHRCEAVLYYNPSGYKNYDETVESLNHIIDSFPVPVVLINSFLPDHPDHCVWYDHIKYAKAPVEYLISQGHERIAFISLPLTQRTTQLRVHGYQEAMETAGIKFEPLLFVESEKLLDTEESGLLDISRSGYEACKQLIQRGLDFTAICCVNDLLAIGALRALDEARMVVPEQVSLFGFDDDPILNYFSPSISSVILPSKQIINHAVDLIIAHLKKSELPQYSDLELTSKLVIRNSVKALTN